ncbi:unnamed protein product [Phyllotreta striolata]|uniref:Peptidase S1 domain-containing protein n=1 Tax=Phyllotreta striolata TaxID=444603 RepID=A0A9N9XL56_PHYSR|nr:unnamed protein product [Phyllotreta striolata]
MKLVIALVCFLTISRAFSNQTEIEAEESSPEAETKTETESESAREIHPDEDTTALPIETTKFMKELKLEAEKFHENLAGPLFERDIESLTSACNKGNRGKYEPSKIMVSLRKGDGLNGYRHICSGVLLNENFVLTAGNCVRNVQERPDVAVEMWRIEEFMDQKQSEYQYYTGAVNHITGYRLSENEGALLRLAEPVLEGPNVTYAILPKSGVSGIFHRFCPAVTTMGWGIRSKRSQYVQCLEVVKLPDEECEEAYRSLIDEGRCTYDSDVSFCTVASKEAHPDVGSPLTCNAAMVFGMVSLVVNDSFPLMNYRVDKELRFINKLIGHRKVTHLKLGKSGGGKSSFAAYLFLLILLVTKFVN